MADTKVTGLDELTTPAAGDMLYIVDDPAGTPLSKKVTFSNLLAGVSGDLTTHEALTTTAHGGVLPVAADPVTVASSRDIAASDGGKLLTVTATAALNCPDGIGSNLQCAVASHGGTTTITADTTLQYLDGGLQTAASGVTVNTQCTLVHLGSNVWVVYGDVTPI